MENKSSKIHHQLTHSADVGSLTMLDASVLQRVTSALQSHSAPTKALFLPFYLSTFNTIQLHKIASLGSYYSTSPLFQIERFHSHTYSFPLLFFIRLTPFPSRAPIAGSPQALLQVHIHCS